MSYFTVLTAAGQAKLANAIALGRVVQVTHIAVGDGNGNAVSMTSPPAESRTALVREVYRGQINTLGTDASNPNWVVAELVIPMDVGGWAIREVGLLDVDGTLLAYGNFPDSYKPQLAEGSGKELVIRMYLETSATSAIELKIDPTVVLSTRAWVLSQINAAAVLPAGVAGQVLVQKTNTRGDVEFRDPTGLSVSIAARTEQQTAAANQQIFTLATLNTTGVAVYVEGLREHSFAVLDATRVQLTRQLPAGTKVLFVQNDPANPYLNRLQRPGSYFFAQL
jgi:phage-related tail fiber protein